MGKIEIYIKLVVFTVIESKLNVFLQKNRLLSTSFSKSSSLDQAVEKLFKEKLNIQPSDCYLEQLYTFSKRDELVVAYYVLFPGYRIKEEDNQNWVKITKFDKKNTDWETVEYALQRFKWKIEYTNVVYSLLPDKFTLSQLQEVYEAILGKSLDKRNFRKKILSLKIIKNTGEMKTQGRARPAQMYKFASKKPQIVEVF